MKIANVIVATCLTIQLPAQSVVARTAQEQSSGQSGRLVTLHLTNVTISQALDEISKQSGLAVNIGERVIGANKRIDIDITGVSAIEAVRVAIRNTDLSVRASGEDRLIVVRQALGHGSIAQGVITGKVTDAKTGKGLSGARVIAGAESRSALTAEDGSYRVAGVPVGAQALSVRMVGYAKQTRSVVVGEGITVTADFKLEPTANVLDQVVVTGTVVQTELKAVPNAITVITAKQIEERGITRIDQLFRGDIPGLFSLEMGSTPDAEVDQVTMFSRGATRINSTVNSNPIKTYIDGIEMADPKYLTQIDPKSIERIEILTGPQASTIYGSNAINGVMQIFTKRGGRGAPNLSLSWLSGLVQNNLSPALSPSHALDGNVSGMQGLVSYALGSGWNYTGAWSPSKQMQRVSLYGSGRRSIGHLTLDFSGRNGWTRNNIRGDGNQTLTELGENGTYTRSASNTGIVPIRKRSLLGRTLSLGVSYTPRSWWSHQLTVGSDASNTQQSISAASYRSNSDTLLQGNNESPYVKSSQSYSSTLQIPFGSVARTTFTYGMDHWRTRSSSVSWSKNAQNGAITESFITRDKPSTNKGAYVQGQLGLWDALFVTYGVRADWNPNYGDEAKVRPGRYGVSYARDIGILSMKLRGSYGRSIRPPSSGQTQGYFNNNTNFTAVYGSPLYSTLPNPELGPEFQQGGEGGVELYIGNRGSLVVTRYNQTVDGLITDLFGVDSVRANQPGAITNVCFATEVNTDGYCYAYQSQSLNIGSIRNQGWELQGSINAGPFTTSGTYSWVKSRVIGITPRYRAKVSGNQEFSPGRPFGLVPEHTWAMNISYTQRGTSASLNLNGIGTIFGTNSELALLTSSSLRLRTLTPRFGSASSSLPTIFRQFNSGYTIANFNASQSLLRNVEGTLQVVNLGDFYQNDASANFPTLGRQVKVGVRWRIQ